MAGTEADPHLQEPAGQESSIIQLAGDWAQSPLPMDALTQWKTLSEEKKSLDYSRFKEAAQNVLFFPSPLPHE